MQSRELLFRDDSVLLLIREVVPLRFASHVCLEQHAAQDEEAADGHDLLDYKRAVGRKVAAQLRPHGPRVLMQRECQLRCALPFAESVRESEGRQQAYQHREGQRHFGCRPFHPGIVVVEVAVVKQDGEGHRHRLNGERPQPHGRVLPGATVPGERHLEEEMRVVAHRHSKEDGARDALRSLTSQASELKIMSLKHARAWKSRLACTCTWAAGISAARRQITRTPRSPFLIFAQIWGQDQGLVVLGVFA
eukprot:4104473-Prymnesium_polylepis.3